ncbi:hypothetical protein MFIFM68171_06548 [Madurella fahalii]|uniref:Glycosyltransferase family 25 protein n=1 Tax=Madurella fahalii TaxID=1157608 RepID=A0ABQ0GF01_9PEZI
MPLRPRNVAVLIILVITLFLWFKHSRPSSVSSLHYLVKSSKTSTDILNATLGFQSIFTINLPSRTDRRDAMTLAAALSGLDITWIDGVASTDVPDKVLPGGDTTMKGGNRGSWRAHMNALQRIVEHNVTSALILEDDADWDIRLKAQMQIFAHAARAFTQPRHRRGGGDPLSSQYRDHPSPSVPITHLPSLPNPQLTPYGDAWDVLWLGHCGTSFPSGAPPNSINTAPASPLRVAIPADPTVPAPQHLKPHPFALADPLAELYPPHTRVVHLSNGTTCTQAYAVSQRGARKLLYRFGLAERLTKGWDLVLGDWCDGAYRPSSVAGGDGDDDGEDGDGGGRGNGKGLPVCVTVQPPLFSHHYGAGGGGKSDISAPGGGFLRVGEGRMGKGMTPYVRWSVRLNMGRLVEAGSGDVEGLVVDQWGEREEGTLGRLGS